MILKLASTPETSIRAFNHCQEINEFFEEIFKWELRNFSQKIRASYWPMGARSNNMVAAVDTVQMKLALRVLDRRDALSELFETYDPDQ